MSDESLVPTGQEYGARQETKDLMVQAGLPLGAAEPAAGGAVRSSPPPPQAGGAPSLDLLASSTPLVPQGQPYTVAGPVQRLQQRAAGSSNMMLRRVVDRLTGDAGA